MEICAQRTAGRRKRARLLADFVFKMVECSMADDYAIFRYEFRPVHFAYLEQKIACAHPVCEEEAVFFQKPDFSIVTDFVILKLVSYRKSKTPALLA